MTNLVRTVRSGSVGLDLVLGGGARLLHRVDGSRRESATLLVRGGPGVGKSVSATDVALRMARALGGDVLYVCIEILPSEVIAQRMGFDDFDPASVIDLANADAHKTSREGPTMVVGMTEMEPSPPEEGGGPDLGRMILDLLRLSLDRGCEPRVVVVDSLSDGYELGFRAPRPIVDAVCKLAVQQGWVLVLIEEAVDDRASPWAFAVDTVLSLDVTPAGRRELRVTKHRFGSAQPGPHRLLVEREGMHVIPCFEAYRYAARDLQLAPVAMNRSLRVPATGESPDWSSFVVPNGVGRVVAMQIDNSQRERSIAEGIGAMASDGSIHTGASIVLCLDEARPDLPTGTLDPMIDGEEWLERVLVRLTGASPIVRVQIILTERFGRHPNQARLREAVGLLVATLKRCGYLVVLIGNGVGSLSHDIDENWRVQSVPGKIAPFVERYRAEGTVRFPVR